MWRVRTFAVFDDPDARFADLQFAESGLCDTVDLQPESKIPQWVKSCHGRLPPSRR
jgi:hypothetical protein